MNLLDLLLQRQQWYKKCALLLVTVGMDKILSCENCIDGSVRQLSTVTTDKEIKSHYMAKIFKTYSVGMIKAVTI